MSNNDLSQPPFDLAAEEADKLLTAANVARMRRDPQLAEDKIRQALQIKPDIAPAHALLGELLLARGDGVSALDAYRRALELTPGNPKYEEGFAKATLAVAEDERKRKRALDAAAGARPPTHARNPTLATLASLVIPGAGQLYNGQVAKAVICLVLVVGLFLLGMAFSGKQIIYWAKSQLVPQMEGAYDVENSGGRGAQLDYHGAISPIGVAFSILCLLAYMWSFIDAGLTAGRMNREDTGKSGWEV